MENVPKRRRINSQKRPLCGLTLAMDFSLVIAIFYSRGQKLAVVPTLLPDIMFTAIRTAYGKRWQSQLPI
jgi:hypothetical protein